MNENCLDCKYCDIHENGAYGSIGESLFSCFMCEENTEDKLLCFERKN